ncbi:tRNA pseudouridine(55) synthase TruB [Paenibacillus sp. PAMC21692]|uniref:tRNA pseudouridine(55) synthase TruB n=1 Tax=Paenibacillus sp. PAMC21692 TaxID=2762320 RepID=UPI00164DE468|nr:tRNA pseudouridine(55) synthase TruB [Paenibacillus sp. PAMC21692]QNK54805.1 tRNA pseudouridine(55) synthase TruB [Paenibacillus sp. PAMC21692]
MDGILAVWKPAGWTSHDVVAKARRLLKMKRIGHAGTLDPMVTGVLPLCLGRSTRVVEYVQERPKAYEAVLKLGIATDTEDMTGEVLAQEPVRRFTEQELEAVLGQFLGEIEQVPPMFSAVKVDGKRLYELAREGKTVDRKSRKVRIHDIRLLASELDMEYPEITFSAVCSKGTYIRTLCVDIGKALGVPATMKSLTRTMSGGIQAEQCLTLEEIEQLQAAGELESRLISPEEAIDHIPKAVVTEEAAAKALRGQKLSLRSASIQESWVHGTLFRVTDTRESFIGIFECDMDIYGLRPVKVFS